jgi:hypothetical protein
MRWSRPVLILLLGLLPLCAAGLPPVLRELAVYPALGLLPGLFLAELLDGEGRALDRWIVALALSPLLSALTGMALLRSGMGLPLGTTLVTVFSCGGCLLLSLAAPAPREEERAVPARGWLGWALGFAGLIALLPVLNPWLLVHADSWFHGGMIWQIVRRGIPPDNPSFAGYPSNYMWTYDFFIAMLTAGRRDPFVLMAILNVVDGLLIVALIHRLGLTLWRSERAATGAAALTVLGLNAGTWLLWPLTLLKALSGEVRGWEEVRRQIGVVHLLDAHAIDALSAPFAYMTNFIDKFAEGTALNYAWVLLLLYLWSALAWLERGRRCFLALALVATVGLLYIHAVVALSAVPVAMAALAGLIAAGTRWTWLPGRRRLAALLLVTGAGAALGAPYLLSVSRGWSPAHSGVHHQFIRLGYRMPWTLLTSLAVIGWLGWGPLVRSFRTRLAIPAVGASFALMMLGFALVVQLPDTSESKFVFQVLFLLALFGGVNFFPAVTALAGRLGRLLAAVALGLVCGVGPVLTVVGFVADPGVRSDPKWHVTPAAARLDAWIRERTPAGAVFLDAGYRELIMVHGQRRLYLGAGYEPFKLGFPAQELARRQAVTADLFGPCVHPDSDVVALRSLGAPVYVLYRPEDDPGAGAPWRELARHEDLCEVVYSAEGYRVFRVRDVARDTPRAD